MARKFLYPTLSDLVDRAGARPCDERQEKELAERAADNDMNKGKNKKSPLEVLKEKRKRQTQMLQFSTDVLANREYQFLSRCILAAMQPLRDSYTTSVNIFGGSVT